MLEAISPLNGFDETINDVHIREVTDFGLVSLAVPLGSEMAFATAVKKETGCTIPAPGQFTRNTKSGKKLIWTTPDQMFLFTADPTAMQETGLRKRLGEKAYATDQSDGWVVLEVSGGRALEALERICPINLHVDSFVEGMAERTVMEHLGVLILRIGPDSWLLMSARSSSQSFLHAVSQSARNIES